MTSLALPFLSLRNIPSNVYSLEIEIPSHHYLDSLSEHHTKGGKCLHSLVLYFVLTASLDSNSFCSESMYVPERVVQNRMSVIRVCNSEYENTAMNDSMCSVKHRAQVLIVGVDYIALIGAAIKFAHNENFTFPVILWLRTRYVSPSCN